MGRSYTSRNSNSKAVHTHHEVTSHVLEINYLILSYLIVTVLI